MCANSVIIVYIFAIQITSTYAVETIFNADPDIEHMEHLACYQCEGDSRQSQSVCDSSYLKLASPEQKHKLLFQCPGNRIAFCVKIVYKYPGYALTHRGCADVRDDKGHELRAGCMVGKSFEHSQATTVICICEGHRCNSSNLRSLNNYLFVFVGTVAYMNFFPFFK